MLVPPGWDYWLGTDQLGRDILTRLVYVARTALFVGLVSAFLGATTGLVLGVASVYFGGTFFLLSVHALHRCLHGLSGHHHGAGHCIDLRQRPAFRHFGDHLANYSGLRPQRPFECAANPRNP